MKVWEVVYVSFVYENKKGNLVEKTKSCLVVGNDELEAEKNFLSENIKFKSIKSITEVKNNILANINPEILKLRSMMKK